MERNDQLEKRLDELHEIEDKWKDLHNNMDLNNDFVDAQIAMVRGRLIEHQAKLNDYWDDSTSRKQHGIDVGLLNTAKAQLHDLLILRLGMSIGHDTTVESAVTQVLNWKDGER